MSGFEHLDPEVRHLADGIALWEEHKPQTPEDWLAVAVRSIAAKDYDPRVGSPIFQALYKAVAGLIECARISGADISGGVPTWPPVDEWAAQEVKQSEDTHQEGVDEYGRKLDVLLESIMRLKPALRNGQIEETIDALVEVARAR